MFETDFYNKANHQKRGKAEWNTWEFGDGCIDIVHICMYTTPSCYPDRGVDSSLCSFEKFMMRHQESVCLHVAWCLL